MSLCWFWQNSFPLPGLDEAEIFGVHDGSNISINDLMCVISNSPSFLLFANVT